MKSIMMAASPYLCKKITSGDFEFGENLIFDRSRSNREVGGIKI